MIFDNNFTRKYQTERRAKDGSQHGEEGIINEIFRRLGINSGWLVDVGAWNGKCFSNTFQLVKTGNYDAVEIEAVDDKYRYQALVETAKEYPKIIPINSKVNSDKDSPDSLSNLLDETPIPIEFELLNLDTDAFDYQIWEGLDYSPKVVCIEFVPQYQMNEFIYEDGAKFTGSSFISLMRLASMKGYTFVCTCGCNMFFVRNDLYGDLK